MSILIALSSVAGVAVLSTVYTRLVERRIVEDPPLDDAGDDRG